MKPATRGNWSPATELLLRLSVVGLRGPAVGTVIGRAAATYSVTVQRLPGSAAKARCVFEMTGLAMVKEADLDRPTLNRPSPFNTIVAWSDFQHTTKGRDGCGWGG